MTPSVLVVGTFPSAQGALAPCQELATRLEAAGWNVLTTSKKRRRLARLADMAATAWRRRDEYDVAEVDVFSGLAFVWAEAVCALLRWAGKPFVLVLHGGNLPDFSHQEPARVAKLLREAARV